MMDEKGECWEMVVFGCGCKVNWGKKIDSGEGEGEQCTEIGG